MGFELYVLVCRPEGKLVVLALDEMSSWKFIALVRSYHPVMECFEMTE